MSAPTLRSRIWNLLRTAKGKRVAVATLAFVLNAAPETLLAEMMPEMLDGTVYCEPGDDGPGFTPRSFPEV